MGISTRATDSPKDCRTTWRGALKKGLFRLQNCFPCATSNESLVAETSRIQRIPIEWVREEIAMMEAQASRLRQSISKRKLARDQDGAAHILSHYEAVLADLEKKIAALTPRVMEKAPTAEQDGR